MRPIGVFDSGLGGLTVVRQLSMLLPGEDILYFGDSGRVPYGTKSPPTIERYAGQDCRFLLSKGVRMIIAACGTVSAVAPHVLEALPVPAVGVVEPACRAAAAATRSGKIGVIGTAATVRTDAYRRIIQAENPAIAVTSAACPLFVPLVESGWNTAGDPVAVPAAARYLEPLIAEGIDTLILGCTHYPLLADVIADILGPAVTLIDAGAETGRAAAALLGEQGLEQPVNRTGKSKFYVSDRPGDFIGVASMFLGRKIDPADVEIVETS